MKKALLIIAVVCVVTASFAQVASAQTFTCTVTRCGPGAGKVYIALSDTASPATFTNRWFYASDAQAKEMLATAMFAMANGKQVQVVVSATAAYSTISRLFILN